MNLKREVAYGLKHVAFWLLLSFLTLLLYGVVQW